MRALVLLVLVAIGCGGSSPADRLVGGWMYSPSYSTAVGFTFDGAGKFTFQRLALTSQTAANDEATTGRYTATDDTLTMTAEKSSCPGTTAVPVAQRYAFQGANLTLADDTGVVIFEPIAAGAGGGAQLTLGCFAADGSFTPSPLTPVAN